jgi:YgiT-type zinc finger domain-containing protein
MTCTVCGQENVSEGLVTLTFEPEDKIVVIKEVPGLVCPNCGEQFVPDETAAHALDIAKAAAGSGASVKVLRYEAA